MRIAWQSAVLCAFFASLAINGVLGILDADWAAIPAMLIGWYLADVASGVVHMYMDYRPCRPGLGFADLYFYPGSRASTDYLDLRRRVMRSAGPMERLVFDFKNHHPRPDALGRRGLFTLTGSTIMIFALPASLLLNVAAGPGFVPGWLIAGLTALIAGGAFAQYFHASLHRAGPPLAVRLMRRAGC